MECDFCDTDDEIEATQVCSKCQRQVCTHHCSRCIGCDRLVCQACAPSGHGECGKCNTTQY